MGGAYGERMPDVVILDDIPLAVSVDRLAPRLHVAARTRDYQDLGALLEQAKQVARPKAMYRVVFIEERGEDNNVVNGVRLTSRVLRMNVEYNERLFAQLATCGTELDEWTASLDDALWSYWGEAIKEVALSCATKELGCDLERRYAATRCSSMAPGSLPDWPLRQQRCLFRLLGDVEKAIGVRLTTSMLMVPNKSVSSVRFETETDFVSCALCPRERCPRRRAVYEEGLYETRYGVGERKA